MSTGLDAFSDEVGQLIKSAGPGKAILKAIGKRVKKKPLQAAGGLFIAVPAAMAAKGGYARGRAMGGPARYLQASRYGPSRSFGINWSRLNRRKKLSKSKLRALSEHYNPKSYSKKSGKKSRS
ncbi:MAG: hypothetical protein DRP42_00700 [Tenericutes bacterium]|nr:MAG: hypothetical protein DRP42_00700 [Mycoplasmatota bacterium]